jgi:hypothetical protein
MDSKKYFIPGNGDHCERVKIKGFVSLEFYQKGKLVHEDHNPNIILNQGKAEVIESLTSGTNRILARMCIGDRGALPSDPTVPKTPEASRTSLYAEVYRQDVDITSTTTDGDVNEILLVSTFKALDIPLSAYSDQTNPVVSEIGLVMIDQITGDPLPRPPVAAPNLPDSDEAVFAMRTYKTVPFEAANETAVTVRYTIFIG